MVGSALLMAACTSRPPREMLLDRGDHYMERGNYATAADDYQTIVDRYGGDWEAQYKLGLCLLELDEVAEARRALTVAQTLRPNDPAVADALAEAMYRQGDEAHLFTFVREQAAMHQSVHDYLRWAEYSMKIGDADSALVAVETAIRIDNGQTAAPYIVAADLAEQTGDDRLAVHRLRQAYTVEPDNERVRDRLVGMGEIPGPTLAVPIGR